MNFTVEGWAAGFLIIGMLIGVCVVGAIALAIVRVLIELLFEGLGVFQNSKWMLKRRTARVQRLQDKVWKLRSRGIIEPPRGFITTEEIFGGPEGDR